MIVIDTSAFIAGFDPFSLSIEQVTTPKVEEEIRENSMAHVRFKTALESGKLKVIAPSTEFEEKVKVQASKIGDSFVLSETDLQLLALALEFKMKGYKPQILTDDYSIQNVAKQMEIEFSALATYGIKRLLEWVRYCPACHREYPINANFSECQVCGTMLKRKPKPNQRKMPKERV